ncbi:MAG: hypothetical protein BV459_00595 [Thermoplasmata archaeon M11B2D]|nr:MAG: hypothetical protein BV459_00595 [Thermoplasmata archaeon M11B2D]
MKTFKRFKTELYESVSVTVYHVTNMYPAINILEKNKFILSVATGVGREETLVPKTKKTKLFYLSTSRSKTGAFQRDYNISGSTTFVLDGRKLANNYASTPVEYFGKDRPVSERESEDRIYSDKPEINNAAKYITEIHIVVGSSFVMNIMGNPAKSKEDLSAYSRMLSLAIKHNIPIYFYEKFNDYLVQNKKKAIDINKIKAGIEKLSQSGNTFDIDSIISKRKNRGTWTDDLALLHAMVFSDNQPDMFKKLDKFDNKDFLKKGFFEFKNTRRPAFNGHKDFYNFVVDTIRSNINYAEEGREQLNQIIRYMEKNKIRSVGDLHGLLYSRYGMAS